MGKIGVQIERLYRVGTLRQAIVFFFCFLIPTQLAKHFWPSWTYVHGIRIDYLSPSLCLIDIVAVLVILLHTRDVFMSFQNKKTQYLGLGLLFIITCNILFSLHPIHTTYEWVITIIRSFAILVVVGRRGEYATPILAGISVISALELLLALAQFVNQSSVQGLWYFLGERKILLSLPEVAKMHVGGREFLRPYGTFSHPNVMGGFFVTLLFFMNTIQKQALSLWQKRFREVILFICPFLILLSFSKMAIAAFVVGSAISIWRDADYKQCVLCKVARLMVLGVLLLIFSSFSGDPYTIQKRFVIGLHGISVFLQHPLFGVGLGNYVLALMNSPVSFKSIPLYQPVHNVPLLFLSEIGITGLMLVYISLRPWIWSFKWKAEYTPLAVVIAITALMDHYWMTQQQTHILLIFIIIFSLRKHDMTARKAINAT